jgi:hypothetical protein
MNNYVAVTIFGEYFTKIENHIFGHDLVILKEIPSIPLYKNRPIFINASCVIFDNCNLHFIYTWLTYKIFPAVKTVYILSQPYQSDIEPHLISFDLYDEPFTIYTPSHYNGMCRNKYIKNLTDGELNAHLEHLYKLPTYYYGNISDIRTTKIHKFMFVIINVLHSLTSTFVNIYNCIPSVSDILMLIFWDSEHDNYFGTTSHKTQIKYPFHDFNSNPAPKVSLFEPNLCLPTVRDEIHNKIHNEINNETQNETHNDRDDIYGRFEIELFLGMFIPYGIILFMLLTLYIFTS